MSEYRVSWVIEITAHSPREAAEEALQIMRDPESQATHFLVENYGDSALTVVHVDLLETTN